MKHLKLFENFNKDAWNDFSDDKESLVDLLSELDYEANGPMSIEDVDAQRENFSKLNVAQLKRAVAKAMGFYSGSIPDLESILMNLKSQYPNGEILNQNNDFHQWGGEEPDDEEEDDEDED